LEGRDPGQACVAGVSQRDTGVVPVRLDFGLGRRRPAGPRWGLCVPAEPYVNLNPAASGCRRGLPMGRLGTWMRITNLYAHTFDARRAWGPPQGSPRPGRRSRTIHCRGVLARE
jgi:hypothetical protein